MGWQDEIWNSGKRQCSIADKERSIKFYRRYFFDRTQEIFRWDGLPDSIPQKWMEHYLQAGGHCLIVKHEGKLYALQGGMGGKLDPYYIPSTYRVANPYLGLNKEYQIGTDNAIIYNDSMVTGLYPLIQKYAEMLAEFDISLRMAAIMSRAPALISATDEKERQSAETFVSQLENGKLSIVASNTVFDGIRTSPLTQGARTVITDLIEGRQYFLAGFYNEIGLNANFNLKRESINSNETELNRDALFPLVENMLRERKEGCERVNAVFGTSWNVDFDSVWEANSMQMEPDDMKEGKTDDTDADPE